MGQGPAIKGVSLQSQYRRAYAQLAMEAPQLSCGRRAQSERYLKKMQAFDDRPQTVVDLRAPSASSVSDWTLLDPNANTRDAPNLIPFSLERWAKTHTECVDLLLSSYLLEYLEQPRRHLRAIARALRPTGKARIEVRNLCSVTGDLEESFLDSQRPNLFSPHALTTMCSHAGLTPLEIDIGSTITLVCRRALDHEGPKVFSGPSARYIAKRCRGVCGPARRVFTPPQGPELWS